MSRSKKSSNDYLDNETESLDETNGQELSKRKKGKEKAKRSKTGNSVVKRMLEIPCDIIGFVLPFFSVMIAFVLVVVDIAKYYIGGGLLPGGNDAVELDLIDSMLPEGWISLYGKKVVIFICAVIAIECIFMIIEVFRKENWLKKTLFFLAIVIGLVVGCLSLGLLGKFGFGLKLAKYLGISSFRKTIVFGGGIFVIYSMLVLLFCDGFKYLYYLMMVPAYCFIVLPFASVLMKTMPKSFALVSVVIVIAMLALMLILLSMGYYRQKAAVISDNQKKTKKIKEKKKKGKIDDSQDEPLTTIAYEGAEIGGASEERVAFAASAGVDDNYSFIDFDDTDDKEDVKLTDESQGETEEKQEIIDDSETIDETVSETAAETTEGDYETEVENDKKASDNSEGEDGTKKENHFKEKCLAFALAVKAGLIKGKNKCGIILADAFRWIKEKTGSLFSTIKGKLKKQELPEVAADGDNQDKKIDGDTGLQFEEAEEHAKKTPADYMKEAMKKNEESVSENVDEELKTKKSKTSEGWKNLKDSIKSKVNAVKDMKNAPAEAMESNDESDIKVEDCIAEFDEIFDNALEEIESKGEVDTVAKSEDVLEDGSQKSSNSNSKDIKEKNKYKNKTSNANKNKGKKKK